MEFYCKIEPVMYVVDLFKLFSIPLFDAFAGKYCGKTLPGLIKTSNQSLYIMFHSDELGAFKGFQAEWSSTPEITGPAKGKINIHFSI